MGILNFFQKTKVQEQPVVIPGPEPKTGRMVQAFSMYNNDIGHRGFTDVVRTSRGFLDSPDGLYGNFLNGLYSASPIHSAIINLKTMLTAGNGYSINGSDMFNMSEKIQLNQLTNQFDNLINNGLVLDYFIHNRVAILVTWNSDNTKIIKLKRLNPASVNINHIDNQMEAVDYLYCWNWALYSTKLPYIKYAKFDQADKENKNQILMVQFPSVEQSLYSRPTYKGAIKSILLDKESDTYQLAYLKNAVSPSVVISFPFDLDEEEKDILISGLRDDFSDTENAGKVFTTFSKTRDVLPSITQLSPIDVSSGFIDLMDATTRKICLGHGIDPQLIGLKTAGSLGNSDFIYQFNLMNQLNIQPSQLSLQTIMNDFLLINGLTCTLEFADADVNQLNPSVASTVVAPSASAAVTTEQLSGDESTEIVVNDTIRGMSGREHQGMMRIMRQYSNGKLTYTQAKVLLASGLGLTDNQINQILQK